MNKLKLFLVDDSKIFIDGLISYFKHVKEIDIIGTAASGKECLEKISNLEANIILMDIKMETPKAGISAANKILKNHLVKPKIIFLTSEYNKIDIHAALNISCSFIDKSCSIPHLITIIKRVYFENKLIVDL